MTKKNKNYIIPEFGPFAGLKVLTTGSLIAMPYASTMLADFGAEVIHIERPGVGDTMRGLAPFCEEDGKKVSTSWAQNGRNKLSLTLELNMKHPESKEIFHGLIKEADIFMENMVWMDKLGITDEDLLEINPELVIAHVSGYGNPAFGGIDEYCNRASYDMIGQAFSGWMYLNGEPDQEPTVAKPWLNDFVAAFVTVFGVLAAYHGVLKTGKGQVVDVAQFEAQALIMADTFTTYSMTDTIKERAGNKSNAFQPYGLFKSKDDYDVALGAFGPGVFNRFVESVGFDAEYFTFNEVSSGEKTLQSDKGKEFDEKVIEWCKARTAEEIELTMQDARVPCSRVNTVKDCFENEHFNARENFIDYEDQTLDKEITAFGIAPKLSGTPGKVWRGAPSLGQDTDQILKEILGYDDEKIEAIREKKLI